MNKYLWRNFGVVTCLFSRKDRLGFIWCSGFSTRTRSSTQYRDYLCIKI